MSHANRLCRFSEWLKFVQPFWFALMLISSTIAAISTYSLAYDLPRAITDPIAADDPLGVLRALEILPAGFPLTSHTFELLNSIAFAVLGISLVFGLIVCGQRKAVIEALVHGYSINFLDVALEQIADQPDVKLIVIKPSYADIKDIRRFERRIKERARQDLGCNIEEMPLGHGNRTVWLIQDLAGGEHPETNYILDLSRNLSAMQFIVERETSGLIGSTFCSAEQKFLVLRDKYFEELSRTFSEYANRRLFFCDVEDAFQMLMA